VSPQTAFDHGTLPERVASRLTCPATSSVTHVGKRDEVLVEVVPGSGYRAKFRCPECRFEFTVSDAQLRRLEA
jgi:transposase-like protein